MQRMAKLALRLRESSFKQISCHHSRSRKNSTAFLVSSTVRKSLVSMRKQPDHWWPQLRSRSERRQSSPESFESVFGPGNETCQRFLQPTRF